MQNLIDQIIPIFVFIAVVAGIISSIKESLTAKPKPQNAPQENQRSRAQSEIAAFLSGSAAPAQRPQQPQEPQRTPQTPQRPPNQSGLQQQAQPQRPKQKQKQKPPRAELAEAQPKRTPKPKPERTIGSGVREHVDSYIGDHVKSHMGRDVDAHVKKEIDERVKSHLGSQSSQAVEMTGQPVNEYAASDLLKALKSPEGVRQAILVSEILSRPKALRR